MRFSYLWIESNTPRNSARASFTATNQAARLIDSSRERVRLSNAIITVEESSTNGTTRNLLLVSAGVLGLLSALVVIESPQSEGEIRSLRSVPSNDNSGASYAADCFFCIGSIPQVFRQKAAEGVADSTSEHRRQFGEPSRIDPEVEAMGAGVAGLFSDGSIVGPNERRSSTTQGKFLIPGHVDPRRVALVILQGSRCHAQVSGGLGISPGAIDVPHDTIGRIVCVSVVNGGALRDALRQIVSADFVLPHEALRDVASGGAFCWCSGSARDFSELQDLFDGPLFCHLGPADFGPLGLRSIQDPRDALSCEAHSAQHLEAATTHAQLGRAQCAWPSEPEPGALRGFEWFVAHPAHSPIAFLLAQGSKISGRHLVRLPLSERTGNQLPRVAA